MSSRRDVLVVDDDEATRILLQTLLTRAGLSVVTAVDGDDAIAAIARCTVDAVVLDLFMPRANGIDFLHRISLEQPHLLRRVIILSAAPDTVIAAARERYGVFCAVRKPADITDLMENILDCLLQEGSEARKAAHAKSGQDAGRQREAG